MAEWLVDFVDHTWCFRAQARQGFRLLQHPEVQLVQRFGRTHPNPLCRWLGMELTRQAGITTSCAICVGC